MFTLTFYKHITLMVNVYANIKQAVSFRTVGDSLAYHRGAYFSSHDRNNGKCTLDGLPCAQFASGAWWFQCCLEANLNGWYASTIKYKGINWATWSGYYSSFSWVEMKIRPIDF